MTTGHYVYSQNTLISLEQVQFKIVSNFEWTISLNLYPPLGNLIIHIAIIQSDISFATFAGGYITPLNKGLDNNLTFTAYLETILKSLIARSMTQ